MRLRCFYYPFSVMRPRVLQTLMLFFDDIWVHASPPAASELDQVLVRTVEALEPRAFLDPMHTQDLDLTPLPASAYTDLGMEGIRRFLQQTEILQTRDVFHIEDGAQLSHTFKEIGELPVSSLMSRIRQLEPKALGRMTKELLSYTWGASLHKSDTGTRDPEDSTFFSEFIPQYLALTLCLNTSMAECHGALSITDREYYDLARKWFREDTQRMRKLAGTERSVAMLRIPTMFSYSWDAVLEARSGVADARAALADVLLSPSGRRLEEDLADLSGLLASAGSRIRMIADESHSTHNYQSEHATANLTVIRERPSVLNAAASPDFELSFLLDVGSEFA